MGIDSEKVRARAAILTEFYRREKRLPSFSEMERLFGLRSKSPVSKAVRQLEALGYLKREPGGRLMPGSIASPLRLIGIVEAGFPSPAEEELADTISLDDMLIKNKLASFSLTVSGDSMIEAGIMPGDLVIVDRSLIPKTGDIVVASLDGKSTMKYYSLKGGKTTLVAGNDKYPPIAVQPGQQLIVHGVVRSAVRVYR